MDMMADLDLWFTNSKLTTLQKKKEKKSCTFWGLNPRPSVSMQLAVILAYLNTLQNGGNA
jgi:hypothetical protein